MRFADTIGLVMERERPGNSIGAILRCLLLFTDFSSSSIDRLRWYCPSSTHEKPTIIYEESFHVVDLGTQLKPVIERWQQTPDLRKCKQCGSVADPK